MRKVIFLFFALLTPFVYAQVGGQSVYQFLNLVQSPRQAALGGKTVTLQDYDVNQAFYNPATINTEMKNQFSTNYSNYFGEVTYGNMAYGFKPFKKLNLFHIGANFVNYGSFDGYDEFGNPTGTFNGNEGALSIGYAHKVNDDFFIGSNVKLITSTLEIYNSIGAAMDFGLLYIHPKTKVNYGLTFRNIGYQIKPYENTREKLPFEIDAGFSQILANVPVRWQITLENLQQFDVAFKNPNRAQATFEGEVTEEKVSFFNNIMRHVIIGAELFPKKAINLRLGYNFRRGQELNILEQRNFSGITAGFGIRFSRFRFDFAHSRYTTAANSNIIGLSINLD
jgi:hypothetical protein